MWTYDDFPGADSVPWQLLIRARFQYQIDAIIASSVVHTIAKVATADVTAKVAEVAAQAVTRAAADQGEVSGERRGQFMDAVANWDGELCPRWWRYFPVPPKPRWIEEFGDPMFLVTIGQALEFVNAAGSPGLQGSLGAVLTELQG